jgi:predicted component of type VI protein secretion system
MPALVYIAEDSPNVSYPLSRGVFTIGNRDDAQLQLPSGQIAPEHAYVAWEEGQYVLYDQGSETGSFVNGDRVTQVILKHNDIVRFGEYRFRVNIMDSAALAAVNNPNQETSRIDLPARVLRRSTQPVPQSAEIRRIIERRPHTLKAAETAQLDGSSLPKKVQVTVGKVDAAVVHKSVSSSPAPSAMATMVATSKPKTQEIAVKKTMAGWIWLFLGIVIGAGVTAAFLLLLKH